MANSLKQKVGERDTKHGLMDLPVSLPPATKKPKMRFAAGGACCRDGVASRGKTKGRIR
jgi:hypothetical protein